MKKKAKILIRITKKGIKKAIRGDFTYKNENITTVAISGVHHLKRNGPKAFARRLKNELIAIDRRHGSNLVFPNGLITGVDKSVIGGWYKKNHKKVTIVIPSYNDLDVLIPCLESIAATTDPDHVKVIVVDDYCDKKHSKELKKLESDQVEILFRSENGGFAKAVNDGMRAADKKSDVILLNSDIVAHPEWLESLQYGAYQFGVDTGIVGPKLLYPDGRIQSAGSYRNTEVPEFFDHYYRFQDENYGPANIPQYCLGVTGACMYIKREFINNVGILDDGFNFAFEDMDLCLRGWQAGYRSLYFPASTLTHHESVTRGKNKTISEKEKQSMDYFWDKWGSWFDNRNVLNESGQVKIIFILQTLGISGGIKIVFEHASRLAERGFDVQVWGLDSQSIPWGVSDKLKIRTFKNYDRLIHNLTPIEAIKVATWWETAFPVWLSSVNQGIPVYFIQEFETWFYPNDIVAQSSVVSCYRKEFINMTTSKYNLDEIMSIGLKATPIPCGYDDSTYKTIPGVKRETNTLLAVGRTFFQKNFEFTFKAWKQLGESRPVMWLFGIEPEIEKWDDKITYHKKPTNEEVNLLYNQASMFVQTSRHEGFSLPILEAMAAGCPVICTDAHGNRDFCFDEKNCLLVEHDDVEGLKKAIAKLQKNKSLRDKLAKQGLETAKNYKWKVIIDRVEDFYKEVARVK